MTESKLVPHQDGTIEVGIRFPSPRKLLRRLMGKDDQVHEHVVTYHVSGGDGTVGLEDAIAGFMEVLGYHLAGTEAAGRSGSRRCLFRGHDGDRERAHRMAHVALRVALAQGKASGSNVELVAAAEGLLTALSGFASGMLEFERLLLVRIGGEGRAHVAVKLLVDD